MYFHSLSLDGRRTNISELMSKSRKGSRVSCRIEDSRFLGILYELEARGVQIFPPLLCQSLSISKVHQALCFTRYMVPNTRVLFRSSHLQTILREYDERKVQKAVIKEDRASLGMGVHPCESLTDLAYKAIHVASLPVVIQPMLEKFKEFRLVIVEDTIVGMEKKGANGIFWNNRFMGGATKFITPSSQIIEFGEEMMRLGNFPWAYIDLLVAEDKMYLSEINLSGSNRELKGYNLNNLKRQMVERWLKNK